MPANETKAPVEQRELLNIREAIKVLGVSRYLFGKLVERGEITPASTKSRLFRRRDLMKILTGEGVSDASRT